MTAHHHGICCITPPHMIERIAKEGSEKQKERAIKALKVSGQIRGQRQSLTEHRHVLTPASRSEKQRLIYDAESDSNLPGILVRSEGENPLEKPAEDEAYDGSGATYDLYFDIYNRNSVDGNGMPIISTVHYLQGYDNAFWNGEQMVYGDGDEDLPEAERLFNRFTIALDIIGHELTHGVVQYEANLAYWDQSGALNESFADIFGSLVKQRLLNQTAVEADWIIGAGIFTGNVNGEGIRSMKDPGTAYDDLLLGKDPQPGHMKDYVTTTQDNGGVHINSGIPNRAFYITAREIGGYAWEKAGKIWYRTLVDKLGQRSDFQEAANQTFAAAGELYGENSTEQNAVKKGWSDVGIVINADKRKGCRLF